jgi:hypothetical protein
MERGYLLDRTHGAFGMGTWLEGAPNVSSTAGLVHRPQMERSLPVVTFRCTGCGYLESFARPDLIDDSNGDGSKKPAMFGEL